jgi:hypothetical protein
MVEAGSPQNCVSDSLYQELLQATDAHILAGLDLDLAHIRYSELREQQKAIEWEVKKLEREWPTLVECHVATNSHLKEKRSLVMEEGGYDRGSALVHTVQKQRLTSFVDLPQYASVKARVLRTECLL